MNISIVKIAGSWQPDALNAVRTVSCNINAEVRIGFDETAALLTNPARLVSDTLANVFLRQRMTYAGS